MFAPSPGLIPLTGLLILIALPLSAQTDSPTATTVRFATFNIAFNRPTEGALRKELEAGDSDPARKIAEVIQRARPDVLLLCEFDYDSDGAGLTAFQEKYLAVPQEGAEPISYPYRFFAPVNTGVDSGIDLDGDGQQGTGNDAFGFGNFPGQYAMAILSRYPIQREQVRTFQKFLWKDMPAALLPQKEDGSSYYSPAALEVFRLSSKSHWDVPIDVDGTLIHFLVSHPTPPVFDGPEDRNGKRNHDEIRLWVDYVSGRADYLTDDRGQTGGLPEGAHFVIAGDLNSDPLDGDSYPNAISQLLDLPNVRSEPVPESAGGPYYAKIQGGANRAHKGNPAYDTGDFSDRNPGNLRIDYCLPSSSLEIVKAGVFWPVADDEGGLAVKASDHRLVWVDLSPQ